MWPGIFLGVLLANAAKGLPWAATSVIAVGNTLAAVAAARLLARFGFEKQLHRVRDALLLLAAAVLSPLIAAFIGTGSLYFAAGVELSLVLPIGLTWWSGDALGVMLMAPLLLAWSTRRLPHLATRRLIEATLLGIGLIALSVMLMGALLSMASNTPYCHWSVGLRSGVVRVEPAWRRWQRRSSLCGMRERLSGRSPLRAITASCSCRYSWRC
jgi:integral membrane sensor domain MASE1